jgi:hypothetical protein
MDPITISAALSPAGGLALNSATDEDEALPSRPTAIGNPKSLREVCVWSI